MLWILIIKINSLHFTQNNETLCLSGFIMEAYSLMSKRSTDDIVKLLMSKSVVEFSEIKTVLDDASRATVFRYLG